MFIAALLLASCANKSPETTKPPTATKEETKEERKSQNVNLGAGTGDKYSLTGKREKLWTVRWKSAVMTIYEEGDAFTGNLTTVDGDIYDDSKVKSKFEGQKASVDKEKEVLILEGAVKIRSLDPEATLFCDRVRYEADKKIIKASGNIRLVGDTGTMSGLSEVWTNPEFTKVATPDMWGERP